MDLLYPPKCQICDKYIEDRNVFICEECESKVLSVDLYPNNRPHLKEIWRLTKYNSGTRQLILDLKFNNKLNRINIIHKILDNALTSNAKLTKLMNKIDIATVVPLHSEREKERGFNQVELIFNDWLKKQNILIEKLILRKKKTEHLYNMNLEERQKELEGAFDLVEGVETIIKDKCILILDDIFTTGTTMSECAEVLKSNGAAEIYGLALASDFKV